MKSTFRATLKTRRALLATALVVAASGLVVGSQASASHGVATLAGSNFEIDNNANLKVDDPPPASDWASIPQGTTSGTEIRGTDKATGQTDDSYVGGTKEDSVCPGETTGSIPNNKSDLLTLQAYQEPGVGTHPGFFNFAWSRVSDPSGTTLMDFEFNQGTSPCNGSPNIQRTVGDKLVEYSIDQGGARASITIRNWGGSAWGPATVLTDPSSLCVVSGNPAPCAAGTINSTTIPANQTDGLSTVDKQPRTFGEAQLDLRLFGGGGANPCVNFGYLTVKSRSSDSFTSQLKDFIKPTPIALGNCAKVVIRKVTDPAGDATSFSYTSTAVTSPATSGSFNLNGVAGSNVQTIVNVVPGSGYTITENALPSGWDFVSLDCSASTGVSVTVDTTLRKGTYTIDSGSDVVDCTYTNKLKRGTIIIDKVTDPSPDPTGTVFDFDGSFDGNKDGQADFTLTDAQTPAQFGNLLPGSYSVSELAEAGWTPQGSTCNDSNSPNAGAINLEPGETVTCTFNNQGRATIVVQKVTVPAGSTQSFNFQSNFATPANFSLTGAAGGNSKTTSGLAPGTYSVAEDALAGWDLTSATCDDNSPVGAISLQPGETVTCTFTNTQRGHIIVVKETDPAGSPQVFPFDENWSDGNQDGQSDFTLTDYDPVTDSPKHDSGALVPGTYAVDELTPAGWEQKPLAVVCSNGDDPGAIHLAAGQTVTCLFMNEQDAHIFVTKVTDPANDTTTEFGFTPTGTGYSTPFTLVNGGINDSGALDPGAYSVAEDDEPGWQLISSSCTSSNGGPAFDPASIDLQAGEIVNCTFTNRKNAGIVVNKIVDGRDPGQSFSFTSNFGVPDLANGGSFASSSLGNLTPGTYNVTEVGVPNWLLTNADPAGVTGQGGNVTCTDGSNSGAISLQAGETVTCTFHNEWQVGAVVVHKTAKHASAPGGVIDQAGVSFTIIDANNVHVQMPPTDANGLTCVENFGFQTVTVHENTPAGYADQPDQHVTIDNVAYCPGSPDLPYAGASDAEFVSFVNVPLTNVTVTVDSQVDGATSSVINCYDKDGNLLDTKTASDGSLFIPNIQPTDPLVATLHCDVFIDP